MAETEGQHKLRTVALLGIIVGIVLIPTGIGAPLIGVSVAALALSTEVARSSMSAGRDAVREETRRAAEHVRRTVTEATKSRPGETPEHPRWWGRKVLQGAAGTARGVRGLRRAMHRRQPGDPGAIGQKPAGPLRRIRSAVRAGAARGAQQTRRRLGQHGQRLRRDGWRGVLPIVAGGLAIPSLRGIRHRSGRWPWRRQQPQQPAPLGPIALGPGPAALPPGSGAPERHEPVADPALEQLAPGGDRGDPNYLPPVNPGYGKSVAPELAPAAIANGEPAAIGGSMPSGNPYAPAMRSPAVPPATGGAATHSEWTMLMDRLREAHLQGVKNYQAALANLKKVNPGEEHYEECRIWLERCTEFLKRIESHIAAVDTLEGPIKAATDALGGPRQRADSSYHARS